MDRNKSLVLKRLPCIYDGLVFLMEFFAGKSNKYRVKEDEYMIKTMYSKVADKTVKFSEDVLDDFRKNVGCFKAETGGMLASSQNEKLIDKCHFDTHSQNTSNTFYYDVESMSEVFREWKSKGFITNGIYHSHPKGMIRPSYHDISSALLHIDFFSLEYFYFPIFQTDRRGFYIMYFYVIHKVGENLEVNLNYVLEATRNGYEYISFQPWKREYKIKELNSYRKSIDRPTKIAKDIAEIEKTRYRTNSVITKTTSKSSDKIGRTNTNIYQVDATAVVEKESTYIDKKENKDNISRWTRIPTQEYFKKVSFLYPDKVLDKVIVCVGTGGARNFLENCARSGFRNYVLIDADVVSPSNIATQGVFISEMGKKKVEVIRDRILDINQEAKVICIDKFLDDKMSDEEFKGYIDRFPNKKSTDYLILGCTDNFEAQKRSSLLALKYSIPYLAAMMYEGGAAAEIIFVYPGVTESCPRCLLRNRFEKYENGFKNDVDSSACPIFATERMNSLKGYIALMLLMYHEDTKNPYSRMLDDVKDQNFVQIRLNPYLKESKLGIGLFDKVFADASRYVYFDETLWIPQHPDRPEFGSEPCRLCGGIGNLKMLKYKWRDVDTRNIRFDNLPATKFAVQMKY